MLNNNEEAKSIYWQDGSSFGVLIPNGNGQLWEHQVGGVSCSHPKMRAHYIQFKESAGTFAFGVYTSSDEYEEKLKYFLDNVPQRYSKVISPRDGENTAKEAWVPVKIDIQYTQMEIEEEIVPDEFEDLVKYDGKDAIMVYANSD